MEQQTVMIHKELAASWLPFRPSGGYKGTFGKVYIVGGSVGFTGAPVFSARAAARTGSGLVYLGVPKTIYPIAAGMCLEAMVSPLSEKDGGLSGDSFFPILNQMNCCNAGLLGPGLGRTWGLTSLICRLLEQVRIPLVLDADALYAIREKKEILNIRRKKGLVTILTPHEGEFTYLGGDLTCGRYEGAKRFATSYGCVLVLKGPRTLIASPEGEVYENTTGNSGMAKGGSGDVLGGMILSFLGQGVKPLEAAALGVWLHGLAGDICKREKGEFGMLPGDMAEKIPEAILTLRPSED